MFEDFIANVSQTIHTSPWLALSAVFIAGLLTASAPCVLAMIPLMMSFVAGGKEKTTVKRAFGFSLLFVLGLSITFVSLGMLAALASQLYGDVSGAWYVVVAIVCLVMGLHLMGVLRFDIPMPFNIEPKTRGIVGALLLGLLFGLVSAPCAAPVLVVMLTYLAGADSSVAYGGVLLLAYALGHSVLILIAGTSMGLARKLIESKRMTRATDVMRRVAGGVIVLIGVYFVYYGFS